MFLDPGAGRRKSQAEASRIGVVPAAQDISASHQSPHRNAHRRPAYSHVLGQLRQSRRASRMQVIENTGLVPGDNFPGFIVAYMFTMTSEKNRGIGIQEPRDSRVQHRRESAADGLISQTKYYASAIRGSTYCRKYFHCNHGTTAARWEAKCAARSSGEKAS